MKRKILCTVLLLIGFVQYSTSQQSLNISLFGELDPVPIRYSGSWGYTDLSGNEYALLGANTGLSVISIDDSLNIQQLDFIPGPASNWREITVVNDYAYVTTEGFGSGQGMQVINKIKRDCVHSLYDTIQKNATLQGFQWLEDDTSPTNTDYTGKPGKDDQILKAKK